MKTFRFGFGIDIVTDLVLEWIYLYILLWEIWFWHRYIHCNRFGFRLDIYMYAMYIVADLVLEWICTIVADLVLEFGLKWKRCSIFGFRMDIVSHLTC